MRSHLNRFGRAISPIHSKLFLFSYGDLKAWCIQIRIVSLPTPSSVAILFSIYFCTSSFTTRKFWYYRNDHRAIIGWDTNLKRLSACSVQHPGFSISAWYPTRFKALRALLLLPTLLRLNIEPSIHQSSARWQRFGVTEARSYPRRSTSWLSSISILEISSSRHGQASSAVLEDLVNTPNSSSIWLAVSAQERKAGLRRYTRFFNLRLRRRGSSCLPQSRRYRS